MLLLEHRKIQKDEQMNFIHIRVPIEIRKAFKALAASKGLSMTQLASSLIVDYLEKKEKLPNTG